MRSDDRSYHEARAEAEIEAAHDARHPEAARVHYVLAAHYLDLAHNIGDEGWAPPQMSAAQAFATPGPTPLPATDIP